MHIRPRGAAALVLLVVAFAGCGGGGSSQPPATAPTARPATAAVDVAGAKASPECVAKVKTLHVTAFSAINDVAKSAKAFLERAHPGLRVELSSSAQDYTEGLNQVSADKAAGRQTDVVVAGLDLLPVYVRQLGAQELHPTLLRASYNQRFLPLGRVDGRQYGIPQQVSVPVLLYNRSLLTRAGVDPAALVDTDGVLAAANKVRAAASGVTAVDLPTGQQFGYWWLNTLAGSKGANVAETASRPAFDTPQAQEAMRFLAKAASSGPQSNDPARNGLLTFGLGKSAMVGASSASVAAIKRAVAGRKDAFQVGVVPFPTLPGGAQHPVAGGNALVVLSTDRCQREMATEMVVALLTPDVIAASVQAVSYLSVDTAATRMLASFYRDHPDIAALNDLAPRLAPPPSWGGARGGELPQVTSDAVVGVQKGADPVKALADLQARAEELTR